ncbi:hypothetical protein Zmor_028485 [Zophobas morio]|uniref:Odorant receptor n=1 Tax=Zophobas morio TaxID=2755281 RepID=A0AA38M3J7_9CUCU|nr:hypothetical protein Zmor_028485 [Zophobas morio]
MYAPCYFGMFYLILSLLRIILATHRNGDALNVIQLWKLQNIDEQIARRIKFEIKTVNAYTIVNTFFALSASVVLMLPSEELKKMYFQLPIIEKYVPAWKNEISFLYLSTYTLIAMALVASCNQVVYATCHFRIQIYLGISAMKKSFSVKIKNSKEVSRLLCARQFQKDVGIKMIFIIKRMNRIFEMTREYYKELSIYVMLFAVSGTLMGMGVLLFFLLAMKLHVGLSLQKCLYAVCVVMSGVSTFAGFITSGQASEDIIEEVHYMWSSFPWYVLNRENSRIYLIFTGIIMRPCKIRFTETVSLNYELGVSLVRAMFSVLSVYLQLLNLDR